MTNVASIRLALLIVGLPLAIPAAAAVLPSSPNACPVAIDATAFRAVPGRRMLDGASVTPCQPEWRLALPLVADKSCPLLAKPETGRAVEQQRLVYKGADGLVEALPCAPIPGGRFVPLTETTSGCPLLTIWAEGYSLERTRFVVDAGSGPAEAVPCLEREDRRLAHRRQPCVPMSIQLPRAGLVRIPAERIDGIAQGRTVTVRACQPVDGAAVATAGGPAAIQRDEGSCRGIYADGDGESFATHRFLLAWPKGSPPEPVTNCLPDVARSYPQDHVDAGWRHDEERRISIGLDQAVIRIEGAERRIGTPRPRPDAVRWHVDAIEAAETGSSERLGCALLKHRRLRATYARPDGTTVQAWLGPAEAVVDAGGCR